MSAAKEQFASVCCELCPEGTVEFSVCQHVAHGTPAVASDGKELAVCADCLEQQPSVTGICEKCAIRLGLMREYRDTVRA
jgi:hypothetical protein